MLVQRVKNIQTDSGREFMMDDQLRYLVDKKFRIGYDRNEPPGDMSATTSSKPPTGVRPGEGSSTGSPTKSEDSGVGSDDDEIVPGEQVIKELFPARKVHAVTEVFPSRIRDAQSHVLGAASF